MVKFKVIHTLTPIFDFRAYIVQERECRYIVSYKQIGQSKEYKVNPEELNPAVNESGRLDLPWVI